MPVAECTERAHEVWQAAREQLPGAQCLDRLRQALALHRRSRGPAAAEETGGDCELFGPCLAPIQTYDALYLCPEARVVSSTVQLCEAAAFLAELLVEWHQAPQRLRLGWARGDEAAVAFELGRESIVSETLRALLGLDAKDAAVGREPGGTPD